MTYAVQEKCGIIDLLQTERQNVGILYQLAKGITKNSVDVPTELDALNYIFLHIPDCMTLLNKRAITKEILFKYLHKKKVSLQEADFTKVVLIKKVIEYWYATIPFKDTANNSDETTTQQQNFTNGEVSDTQQQTSNASALVETRNKVPSLLTLASASTSVVINDSSEFPIHLLARKFSEWFFDNYNKDSLKLNDFWSDARLLLRITANDGIDEQLSEDSTSLLENLIETRQRFGFYFNPNLTHAGVQGRMDVHGLVLVLACGTLHTQQDCVGVFECVFGLLRDPFAENNWKSKNIKLMLRSKGAPVMPSLEESDTLREALELPVPQGELT